MGKRSKWQAGFSPVNIAYAYYVYITLQFIQKFFGSNCILIYFNICVKPLVLP